MKRILFTTAFITSALLVQAQTFIRIGENVKAKKIKADIGLYLPQLTTTQINAYSNPVAGIQVFNTTTDLLNFYDGDEWIVVGEIQETGWSLSGNAGTANPNYIGTTDNAPVWLSSGSPFGSYGSYIYASSADAGTAEALIFSADSTEKNYNNVTVNAKFGYTQLSAYNTLGDTAFQLTVTKDSAYISKDFSRIYTLPTGAPSAGNVLTAVTGNGSLSWEAISNSITIGDDITGYTSGALLYTNVTGDLSQSSGITFDGTNLSLSGGIYTTDLIVKSNDNTGVSHFSMPTGAGTLWYQLPADDGDASEVLTTDGSGNLSWGSVVASGTYTPTLTNVTNLDGSTAFTCQYMRVGNTVTVSGKFEADGTAGAATELGLSLPIASNFSAEEQAGGKAWCPSAAGMIAVQADATNDRVAFRWVQNPSVLTSVEYSFTYTYLIN